MSSKSDGDLEKAWCAEEAKDSQNGVTHKYNCHKLQTSEHNIQVIHKTSQGEGQKNDDASCLKQFQANLGAIT